MDEITAFLEDALYDPAFVTFDPKSTTRAMQPNVRDITYSIYRPDLAALGAVDGLMPSGLPISNNDPLSRRDAGLEFLNVTNRLTTTLTSGQDSRRQEVKVYKITNVSKSPVDTHLLIIVHGLSNQARLVNASGNTKNGDPYLRVFLPDGILLPGQSITETLDFNGTSNPGNYSLSFLSGQGKP